MNEIPTPKNYADYVHARQLRTMAVISKQDVISGRQVKMENLSVKMITDAGYVYNSAHDTLERKNG